MTSAGPHRGAAVFVCDARLNRAECICCGGFTEAGGTPAFEAPEGSLVLGNYCSEECWADWEEQLRREKAWRDSATCSTCGFDNHEHADDCGASR